ncbi:MAG: phenylacetate--CoA ligase family protein [Chitinivibrionia bacterium]|nr:phenylacetate--CoA ligase family protein [Chitinivibrionia bacterium]
MAITPLEAWIGEKAGIAPELTGRSFAEALQGYQLRKLNETIGYARRASPFYRPRLSFLPAVPLSALSDMARLPFTTPSDIAAEPFAFLAVRQNEVARIVTLRTSGSTGQPKRLFFTEEDLELTVNFFHRGMATLVRPGQRVAILLPGKMADSVGDLLLRGLRRMDAQALVYGPVTDPLDAVSVVTSFGAHCLVGIPTQVLAMARSRRGAAIGKGPIESILLSTDYVPRAIADTLEAAWGCGVFTHYGMTEMGLGGGVECAALDGYHLREADLYFEVVDHATGKPCPDGVTGEVVFTTLTRRGMPLIRYRTGDIARIISEPCPCGSALRRLERVKGRWDGSFCLGPDSLLNLPDMDELLFRLPNLLDYRATISKNEAGNFHLHIDAQVTEESPILRDKDVLRALNGIDAIRKTVGTNLEIPTVRLSANKCWSTTGVAKRRIITTL